MSYKLLLAKDKKLAPLLINEIIEPQLKVNIPLELVRSIVSQQLSTKVAAVIYQRFLNLFPQEPTIDMILKKSIEAYRAIGFSYSKASYVHNVAAFCQEHGVTDTYLHSLSSNEIIELLTQIKGVGKWTVEMLLMFSLKREDVFAVDDLGIQQAMCKLYKIDATDKKLMKQKMIKIAAKWNPYQTYACLHLWGWKDAK